MKEKITILIALFIFSTVLMWGQNTLTVTSNADSGEGSLRDVIASSADNDSIVIQDDINLIILASEISTANSLKINGQGAIVRVTEPKVSGYRPLEFVSSGDGIIINVSLYNLTLIGGDISAQLTTQEKNGGALYVKRASLKLMNCTLTGKAYSGGGLYSEGSTTLYMDGCVIDSCVVTHDHAGASGGFSSGFTIKNTTISNNDATAYGGCSGIDVTGTSVGTISNCIFKNNVSKSGRGGSALSYRSTSSLSFLTVEKCLFEGNINKGTDGGSAFVKQEAASTCVLTNCTFYNNSGGRGSVYLYAGKSTLVNCSFAANITASGADAKYGGGLYITGGSPTVTLVNNILAYNYNGAGGTKDVYVSSATLDGVKNLYAVEQGVGSSLTGRIGFSYDMENRDNDTKLFASYTTNSDGKKIPVLETSTGTLPLHANSVARASGTASYASVSIPTTDKRGVERYVPATPCIGSYEYTPLTNVNSVNVRNNVKYIDNQLIVNADNEGTVHVYSVAGQVLIVKKLLKGENRIFVPATGIVLVRIANQMEKILIP